MVGSAVRGAVNFLDRKSVAVPKCTALRSHEKFPRQMHLMKVAQIAPGNVDTVLRSMKNTFTSVKREANRPNRGGRVQPGHYQGINNNCGDFVSRMLGEGLGISTCGLTTLKKSVQ